MENQNHLITLLLPIKELAPTEISPGAALCTLFVQSDTKIHNQNSKNKNYSLKSYYKKTCQADESNRCWTISQFLNQPSLDLQHFQTWFQI